jgi:O-antigen/teichoic acid export membrane protein
MLRNVAMVLRGVVFAQAVGLLILPLLSRLFGPEAFSAAQIYQTMLGVLMVFVSLKFEVAILPVSTDEEAGHVMWLALGTVAATTTLTALAAAGALLVQPQWLAWLPFSIWLLILGMLTGGTGMVLTYVLTRQSRFRASSNSKVVQSLGYAGSAVGLGAVAPSATGLVAADLVGRAFSMLQMARVIAKDYPRMLHLPARREWIRLARKYRDYPLFTMPGGLINALGTALAPLLVLTMFGVTVSGQFAIADRAIMFPVALVAIAVAQVYSARFSVLLRERSLAIRPEFRRLVITMFALGAGPSLALAAFGPAAFTIVLGPDWTQAGEFARLLAPAVLGGFVAGSVNMVLILIERQSRQLALDLLRLTLLAAPWPFIAWMGLGPGIAIAAYSLLSVCVNLTFLFVVDRELVKLAETHRVIET